MRLAISFCFMVLLFFVTTVKPQTIRRTTTLQTTTRGLRITPTTTKLQDETTQTEFFDDQVEERREIDPISFLSDFGYVPKNRPVLQSSSSPGISLRSLMQSKPQPPVSNITPIPDAFSLRQAIARFQKMVKLNVTGVLDNATRDFMAMARCGVSDESAVNFMLNSSTSSTANKRTKRSSSSEGSFVLAPGPYWDKTMLTYWINRTAIPPRLEASIDNNLQGIIEQWAAASGGIQLNEVDDEAAADIKIKFARRDHGDGQPFDGPGGVLGHAFYPNSPYKGEIHFDLDETWVDLASRGNPGRSFVHVALHEFGHTLGLEHSPDTKAVMYPYFPGKAMTVAAELSDDDKKGVKKVFQLMTGSDSLLTPRSMPSNVARMATARSAPTTTTRTLTQRATTQRVPTTTTFWAVSDEATIGFNRNLLVRTRATTSSYQQLVTTKGLNDTDKRSCAYLKRNALQSIAFPFDSLSNGIFTIDNLLFKMEDIRNLHPQTINRTLPFVSSNPTDRVSSMLALSTDDPNRVTLDVFQNTQFWRFDLYQHYDVPLDLWNMTGILNDLTVVAQEGYPKQIAVEFGGIQLSNPIVFELAFDNSIIFMSPSHYWIWRRGYAVSSDARPIEDHPVLRKIPVRPPLLKAAAFIDGRTHFFAANGSFWSWQPSTRYNMMAAGRSDYWVLEDLQLVRSQSDDYGLWTGPFDTARWIAQCR